MVGSEPLTARVVRVTRPDTFMVRTYVPQVTANATLCCVLAGVRCKKAARQHILDWVEIHSDHGRLRLVTACLRHTSRGGLADHADGCSSSASPRNGRRTTWTRSET